jgi:thioredoxin reductase (NADPH)
MKMQAGAERFGSQIEYAEVVSVDFSEPVKKIKTTSKELFAYAVIVATGANPKQLQVKGENENIGRGVHYCAHCDGRFYKDKTVVVAGGGNTAVSDALYLSHLAKKVYIVHRRDTFRATKIYTDLLDKAQNVEKVTSVNIKEIIAEGKVRGVRVEDAKGESRTIECDGVFVSIGRTPASEVFPQLEKDEQGYIIAGEDTKTNKDGVFVVGDVRTKPLRQVVTAVSDGATAVHFAEEYIAKVKG